MVDSVRARVADWLQILLSLPTVYQAGMVASPAIVAVFTLVASWSMWLIVGLTVVTVAMSVCLGLYFGKRRAVASPVPEVRVDPPLRTAVRSRGTASVDLDQPLISGHDVGIDAADDSTVKVRKGIIQ
jgi:hypothetical protein